MPKKSATYYHTYWQKHKAKKAYREQTGGWMVLKNWNGKPWIVFAESEYHARLWASHRGIPHYAVQFVRSEHTFSDRKPDKINGLVFVGKWYKNPFIQRHDNFSSILESHYPDWKSYASIQCIEPIEVVEEKKACNRKVEVVAYAA